MLSLRVYFCLPASERVFVRGSGALFPFLRVDFFLPVSWEGSRWSVSSVSVTFVCGYYF